MSGKYDFSAFEKLPDLNNTKNNKNLGYPNMTIFSGSTGSGKTFLLFKCLLSKNFFDYDELYILTSTSNSIQYKFLKYCFQYNINKEIIWELFQFINKYDIKILDKIIRTFADTIEPEDRKNFTKLVISDKVDQFPVLEEFEVEKKKLIIGDDIINNVSYNILIENYFTRGRHFNVSCIYLTQNYTLVPITIRRNLSNLFLFKTGKTNLSYIYKEVAQSIIDDKEEFYLKCNRTWRDKYTYIFLNRVDGIITDDVFTSPNKKKEILENEKD
jgi:hypothetical protein